MFIGLLFSFFYFNVQAVAAENLERRNPYNLSNFVESEHFVVYWGEGIEQFSAVELLDTLEHAWVRLIIDLRFERPITTQEFKLNIYISGTGQVPYNDKQGGFAILDNQLHEAFILNKNVLNRPDLFLGATHEFFHTIQSSYGLIRSDAMVGVGWLGEALSNWSVPATWLEIETTAQNSLAQYAFYPQYSLDHINPSQAGDEYYLLSGHQYGTYIFFEYLVKVTNDPDFVLNFLQYLKPIVAQSNNENALDQLMLFVDLNYGLSLKSLFAFFIAKNAEWDYPDKDIYTEVLAIQRQSFKDEHIAQTVEVIDNQWHEAPQKTLPRRWAANYIKLNQITNGSLEIGFEGNHLGDEGSAAEWRVNVVISRDGNNEYIELPLQDGKIGSYKIPSSNASAVWLAIAITSETKSLKQRFAYRYQFSHTGQTQASPTTQVIYESEKITNKEEVNSDGGSMSFLLIFIFLCLFRTK